MLDALSQLLYALSLSWRYQRVLPYINKILTGLKNLILHSNVEIFLVSVLQTIHYFYASPGETLAHIELLSGKAIKGLIHVLAADEAQWNGIKDCAVNVIREITLCK